MTPTSATAAAAAAETGTVNSDSRETRAGDGSMTAELVDLTEQEVVSMSRLFGLLGDPTRLKIMLLLCKGEMNVSALCAALGLPQPTVSHHLGLLRRGSLLQTRRAGKNIHYALDGRIEYTDGCELAIAGTAGLRVRIIK